jgi:hypothetical protein
MTQRMPARISTAGVQLISVMFARRVIYFRSLPCAAWLAGLLQACLCADANPGTAIASGQEQCGGCTNITASSMHRTYPLIRCAQVSAKSCVMRCRPAQSDRRDCLSLAEAMTHSHSTLPTGTSALCFTTFMGAVSRAWIQHRISMVASMQRPRHLNVKLAATD